MAWTTQKSLQALRVLRAHARPYRTTLIWGCVATLGVVLCRLAMPWPLRGFIELVLPGESRSGRLVVDHLPAWGEPSVWLVASYVLLAVGLGLCEMVLRIAMKSFASGTVHHMRSTALRSLIAGKTRGEKAESAELISRLIGDVGRIKAEFSGILVHGAQNGLLFLGVCVVFLFLSPKLGLFFLLGGVLAAAIGYAATLPVAASATRHRKKEGAYATMIEDAIARGAVPTRVENQNLRSARADVSTTRMISSSSLLVHVSLALVTAAALWVAVTDVQAGRLMPGELFLFIAYALIVHRRMVQVGRQMARSGKMFAHIRRVASLMKEQHVATPEPQMNPLAAGLRLEAVKLFSVRTPKARARLRDINLEIAAGTQVAVLGATGAGKSSLLRLLAGRLVPDRGCVFWNEEDITNAMPALMREVSYMPQSVLFTPSHIWRVLGLPHPEPLNAMRQDILRRLGGWKLIQTLPKGVEAKVGSRTVTDNEARALRLGDILTSASRVWVLDAPLEGLEKIAALKRLKVIFEKAAGRTLILSMTQPMKMDKFGRVVVMRKGRIDFNGTPVEWKAWQQREAEGPSALAVEADDHETP